MDAMQVLIMLVCLLAVVGLVVSWLTPVVRPGKKRTEAAVAAIILDGGGRVLQTQRDRDPKSGLWHLPGGGIEPGEEHADAVIREVKEELGCDIEIIAGPTAATTGHYPEVDRHVLCIYYVCRIVSGQPRCGDGTRDWQFADEAETQRLVSQGQYLESCRTALNDSLDWNLTLRQ